MFQNFQFNNNSKTKSRLFSESGAGFTIIEMVVVVSIITVLLAITLSDFQQTKLQLSLSRVAYKFEQDTRRAQAFALSSTPYIDPGGVSHPVAGYGIYVDSSSGNNKKYIIYADALPGNQHYDPGSDYPVETNDFSSTEPGIIVKQMNNITGSTASINFTAPIPVTTITPTATNNIVEVVFAFASNLAKTRTVSINTAGLVLVK
jgi:prepilin-type N-terminal cleavage/methylation domain-containing protein